MQRVKKVLTRKTIFLFLFLSIFVFGFVKKSTTPYPFPKLRFFPEMPQSNSNPVTIEGAKLGRYLFYDAVLSADSTISCSSCHKQAYAFSDAPNQFSQGNNGNLMKRNTLPLFNLAWYPSLFWDGRAASIEAQVMHPLSAKDEMNINWKTTISKLKKNKFYSELFRNAFNSSKIDSVQITNALAQFLRTLLSYQSKYDKMIVGKNAFTKDEVDGFVLVNEQTKGDCLHCHTTDGNALGTILTFSNNGLDPILTPEKYPDKGRGIFTGKQSDYGKFKIPSLRNIALTAPYMHDGRFKTLEEVIDFYSEGVKLCANIDSKMEFVHQGGAKLSKEEKRKILSFLIALTDSDFVSNPEFSNPFKTD